jgi:hypothetical protein
MRELNTEIDINASAERVWRVLTDFNAYSQWNPFIRRVEGKPEVGSRLSIVIRPPDAQAMKFSPTVLTVEPERELRWLGRLLVRGLFDGEHIFRIEAVDADRVRFQHREEFRGLLVPLLWKSLDTGTRRGFHEMNFALKERVETGKDL